MEESYDSRENKKKLSFHAVYGSTQLYPPSYTQLVEEYTFETLDLKTNKFFIGNDKFYFLMEATRSVDGTHYDGITGIMSFDGKELRTELNNSQIVGTSILPTSSNLSSFTKIGSSFYATDEINSLAYNQMYSDSSDVTADKSASIVTNIIDYGNPLEEKQLNKISIFFSKVTADNQPSVDSTIDVLYRKPGDSTWIRVYLKTLTGDERKIEIVRDVQNSKEFPIFEEIQIAVKVNQKVVLRRIEIEAEPRKSGISS